ncbi:MAG TPA: hypothetical protein VNO54_17465 [Streptosporangiaceae bacterium]|nr:hypothetical protein [Streptosporangiaceae bacterium]
MPSVDVAGLVEALAARAHWPYGVVASVMNEAPEVLPDRLHAGVARLARNSTAIDAMIGLVDVEVLRAEASRGIAVLAEGADPPGEPGRVADRLAVPAGSAPAGQ